MDKSHACEDYPTAESDRTRDRLSELPDSLALEILSLLEMKDVVRTTILSKRWNDLWTTVPCLDFSDSYRSLVHGALAKWKGDKILKFTIAFWEDDPPSSDVLDSWLLVPIDKQVEDLFMYLEPYMDPQYCVPQRLYACSSFTKLSLSYCNLKIEENVNVQWNHLKSLKIEHPSYLSGDTMNRIISGAPLLEELMLLSLEICENFSIQSTSLKMLKIGRDNVSSISSIVMPNAMLRIWGPNLLSLEISGCVYGTCLLDVPSLTNAIICLKESCDIIFRRINEEFPPLQMFDQVFRSIRHVEKLTLSGLSIQLLLEMKENDMVAQFSNTKFLKLYAADALGMHDVLGMFPELLMLVIKLEKDRYHTINEEPHVATVDALYSLACYLMASEMTFLNPSLLQLKTIEITWSIREASIFPMVEFLLENADMLEKMVLRLRNCGADRKTFILAKKKVLSMPRSSPTAQVIISKQW